MKAKKDTGVIRTMLYVGAASVIGAALWTHVLNEKVAEVKLRITRPKHDNVIDFRKAKKELMKRGR